jgi:hypothetical protein
MPMNDEELHRRITARQPANAIAAGMGRTVDGIRGRAQQLHLTSPSSQRPWREFGQPSWWGRRSPETD